MLQAGQTILNGKYRILRLIGEGGMARVWLAEELTFGGRQVAIKEPRADLLPDLAQEVRLRYQREVQVCAALEKARVPNIVRAITAEPVDDTLLLVMEYMPGGDLESLLREAREGLEIDRAVAIVVNLLQALEGLHDYTLEIVHRDIKPSNVLFDDEGRVRLADFGLAQLSGMSGRSQFQGGPHPGTPMYMAPEQGRSPDPLMPAADLYALGCVLFEMLTGKRYKCYRPGTRASELRQEVPPWLDEVLAGMLMEDPWNRIRGAAEMAAALQQAQADAQREAVERAQPAKEELRRREAAERVRQEEAERARRAARARVPPWMWAIVAMTLLAAGMGVGLILSGGGWGTPTPAIRTTAVAVVPLPTTAAAPNETPVPATDSPVPTPTDTPQPPSTSAPTPTSSSAPRPPTATPSGETVSHHTVQRGETLSEIASAHGVTVQAIIDANGLGNYIVTGQVLIIPASGQNPPNPTPKPMEPVAGDTQTRSKDGMVMVYVPAGAFTMGSDDGDSDEKPVHTVTLSAFWIDRTEVTNAQYRKCVQAGACTAPSESRSSSRDSYYDNSSFDDYPIIYVNWDQARAYCGWAGARLPTEAEWEKAARGTDGRKYPWGNQDPDCNRANHGSCVGDTSQVGRYPAGASPYGALDMAGNVWEWLNDWYDGGYYARSPANNPRGPDSGNYRYRVLRGGSWDNDPYNVRVANRSNHSTPAGRGNNVSFRCLASSPGE